MNIGDQFDFSKKLKDKKVNKNTKQTLKFKPKKIVSKYKSYTEMFWA